jgi:uracil-DNA glycosylase
MISRYDQGVLEKILLDCCTSPMTRPWAPFFKQEMAKPYFSNLDFMISQYEKLETVFPGPYQIFRAFFVAPEDVRVIILGQDPYHEAGQAMGLAFSVPDSCKTPPSLRNIKKELLDDVGVELPGNNLEGWAEQGMFLLNTVLTVSEGKANSHAGHGWEIFTANAIQYVLEHNCRPLSVILWGKPAQKYKTLFDKREAPTLILESAHPSPLSAYRGFFGSKPFSKTNSFFAAHGAPQINWGAQF